MSDNNEYLDNLTDKEIKERMNIRIQNSEQERKTNLAHIAVAKQALKLRVDKCICKTNLLKQIKHFQIESNVIELEISLLRNHRQTIEQEKSVPNKIEEKQRKETNKKVFEGGNTRIVIKKQEQEASLRKLKEQEKALEELADRCKCQADLMKKMVDLENANAVIDVEVNLLTKYYQDENLLIKYAEGTLLSWSIGYRKTILNFIGNERF